MSTAWVAGSVRALSLCRRRLGSGGAREIASCGGLARAVERLSATAYGHDVQPGQSLAEAQHAVLDTLLWHLRVLAGWQPPAGTDAVRLLAAGFEIRNVDELMRSWAGEEADPAHHLGTLETAWSRLARAESPAHLVDVLRTSAWGDPGGTSPRDVLLGMQLTWADRVVGGVPEAAVWAQAATALLVAREGLLAQGTPLAADARLRARYVVGSAAVQALLEGGGTPAGAAHLLPSRVRWAFDGVSEASGLWLAEVAWWRRVERDALAVTRRSRFGRATVVATAALLAVDAWRARAALEAAAWGADPASREAYDALA